MNGDADARLVVADATVTVSSASRSTECGANASLTALTPNADNRPTHVVSRSGRFGRRRVETPRLSGQESFSRGSHSSIGLPSGSCARANLPFGYSFGSTFPATP